MVLEIFASVSHFAVSSPAVLGVGLAASLFLMSVVAVGYFCCRGLERPTLELVYHGLQTPTPSPSRRRFVRARCTSGSTGRKRRRSDGIGQCSDSPLLVRHNQERPFIARHGQDSPLLTRHDQESLLLIRHDQDIALLIGHEQDSPLPTRHDQERPLLTRHDQDSPLLVRRNQAYPGVPLPAGDKQRSVKDAPLCIHNREGSEISLLESHNQECSEKALLCGHRQECSDNTLLCGHRQKCANNSLQTRDSDVQLERHTGCDPQRLHAIQCSESATAVRQDPTYHGHVMRPGDAQECVEAARLGGDGRPASCWAGAPCGQTGSTLPAAVLTRGWGRADVHSATPVHSASTTTDRRAATRQDSSEVTRCGSAEEADPRPSLPPPGPWLPRPPAGRRQERMSGVGSELDKAALGQEAASRV